jgi:hypothetical protein
MVKYNIEGNIDFYDELYKSLDIEENNHKTDEDLNLCLITKEQLVDKYFTMECGHKFNYIPLFNDIKNHKQKFNGFEVSKCQLKLDEIRCPYCRNKQKGVLPYYEELLLEKVNGVNHIFDNIKVKGTSLSKKLCQVLVEKSGVSNKCNLIGNKIDFNTLKTNTYPFNQAEIHIIDDCYYCYKHKNQKIKEYKNCIIYSMKQDLKLKKIQEIEALKKAKLEEEHKKVFKNQFMNMVMDTSGNYKVLKPKNTLLTDLSGNYQYDMSYNYINDPSFNYLNDLSGNNLSNSSQVNIIPVENKCVEILKTGKNKGNSCGCKLFAENLCQRHYNLKNKQLTI